MPFGSDVINSNIESQFAGPTGMLFTPKLKAKPLKSGTPTATHSAESSTRHQHYICTYRGASELSCWGWPHHILLLDLENDEIRPREPAFAIIGVGGQRMGPVGVQEMIVIFLVALVLFGPKKLPELGKTIAKAVSEFRRAQSDLKATFEKEMKSLEAENEALKEATRQTAIDLSAYSNIDLTGGTSGTYGADTHPADAATDWHGVESGAPTTVSASEVPGAESHGSRQSSDAQTSVAEASPPVVHAVGETVARGEALASDKPAAVSAEAPAAAYTLHEAPLHETQNS